MADAPCHGTKYHNFSDDHPDGIINEDVEWKNLFTFLKFFTTDYIFVQVKESYTEKMVIEFD